MNAKVICIGSELVSGNIQETNSIYIAERLSELGLDVSARIIIADDEELILSCLKAVLDNSSIIVISGGLGPTTDDLTKETVAKFFKMSMVFNKQEHQRITDYFRTLNIAMSPGNNKQMYFPIGAKILINHKGTASGFYFESANKTICVLPGPPYEMKPLLKKFILAYEKNKKIKIKAFTFEYRFIGITESKLSDKLEELLIDNCLKSILAKHGEIIFSLKVWASSLNEAAEINEKAERFIRNNLDKYCFSYNHGSIDKIIAIILKEKKLSLSIAESCTGGLLAARFVENSGASSYYLGGINTYANSAKTDILGVSMDTLYNHGAVSKEAALEMAEKCRTIFNSDFALAVTGIAGPKGGSKDKPVGLVYIAISSPQGSHCEKYIFPGDRSSIRNTAVNFSLRLLYKHLSA